MKKVLIVDDQEVFRTQFADTLETVGYDVTTTASGREALALTSTTRFAGVVFDTTLPDVDLETFVRTVCARAVIAPKIIPATPVYNEVTYLRLRNAHFHPIVVKSVFRPHRFAQLIEGALETYRASDDLEQLSALIASFLDRIRSEAGDDVSCVLNELGSETLLKELDLQELGFQGLV